MLRRPSPPNRRALPTQIPIYTLKIRNRRNPRRISNLHFSNLYKSGAFFSLDYASGLSSSAPSAPLRWTPLFAALSLALPRPPRAKPRRILIYGTGIKSRMRRASSSRASNASRGILPLQMREPRAKLQRTLIYGNGIKFSRKSLKTKDRDHA